MSMATESVAVTLATATARLLMARSQGNGAKGEEAAAMAGGNGGTACVSWLRLRQHEQWRRP